jgi:hypothetical protein
MKQELTGPKKKGNQGLPNYTRATLKQQRKRKFNIGANLLKKAIFGEESPDMGDRRWIDYEEAYEILSAQGVWELGDSKVQKRHIERVLTAIRRKRAYKELVDGRRKSNPGLYDEESRMDVVVDNDTAKWRRRGVPATGGKMCFGLVKSEEGEER